MFFVSNVSSQVVYREISDSLDIQHFYFGGLGGSVSFVDFNGDGMDDLTLASANNQEIAFFLNSPEGLTPIDLGIIIIQEINQITWVDYDNDGDKDLYVTGFQSTNHLFKNEGDLNFNDITINSGLSLATTNSYGATWIDINRDGWLDLIYADRAFPLDLGENQNRIFLNNSDDTFTEITDSAMAQDKGKQPFCIGAIDYNLDKWPDLYYTHDREKTTVLLENQKNNSFTDVSMETNSSFLMDGMGICVSDITNDGLPDLYITNIEDGNKLLINHYNQNTGQYSFTEESQERGCAFNMLSWGCSFLDCDNDGDEDLYVSAATASNNDRSSIMYLNDGQGFFTDSISFMGDTLRSYSNASGDLNNDGYLDLAVLNTFNDPAQIWLNETINFNNWVKINLEGVWSNKEGNGAIATIYAQGKTQLRNKTSTSSFMGQHSNTLHFGLGDYNGLIDSIKVQWPTGHIDVLYDQELNTSINIKEGQTTDSILVDEDVVLLNPSIIDSTLFLDYTAESNIAHVVRHQNFLGGGIAFFDLDNDGDEDVYITSGLGKDLLYRNDGTGVFTDITLGSGTHLSEIFYTNGVIAGDINNDGFTDLFVTTTGNQQEQFARNLLFLNNGNETFTEIWLQQTDDDKSASMGASFIDYDMDGYLDIYVVNYVEDPGFLYDSLGVIIGFDHDCFENKMYRNRDGSFYFDDVTLELQLDDYGCALAVLNTDFDMDGDGDLLLANDFGEFIIPNAMFRNDSLNFTNVSDQWGTNQGIYGMGIAVGDLNNDLDLDYYITNLGSNILLQREENQFVEIAESADVQDTWVIQDSILSVSWGTSFLDYDNDTDLDLFVSNGYVPGPNFIPTSVNNNDILFRNNGEADFSVLDPSESGVQNNFTSRGMAVADIDNDGDQDMISVVLNVPLNANGWETKVYKNLIGQNQNWLQVDLEGILSNKDAIGATATIYAENYNSVQEVNGGNSHCSHNSKILHYGLNEIDIVDSLKITWPSRSKTQVLRDISINQKIYVLEDTTGTFISLDTMTLDTTMIDTMIIDTMMNDTTLSIYNLELEESIAIHPNPASQFFIVQSTLPILRFKIYNLQGELVREEDLYNGPKYFARNVDLLNNGCFIVVFTLPDGRMVKKRLIIQH